MIVVRIFQSEEGNIQRFLVTGHAGSAKYGRDIVCAAVSALTINFYNSIEQLCHVDLEHDIRDGYYDVLVTDEIKVQLLAQSLSVGLRGIANEYGRYMTVELVNA